MPILTFSPMTITPLAALMTTRPSASGVTVSASSWAMNPTGFVRACGLGELDLDEGGVAAGDGDPGNAASMAFCTALAVTKSGLRRTIETTLLARNCDTTSFSTMAPSEIVPTVFAAVGIRGGHDPTLRDGVGLPVGRLEVGLQEDAPVEVARVADAGHGDVDAVADARERRELRAHHHHGRVLAPHVCGATVTPKLDTRDDREERRSDEVDESPLPSRPVTRPRPSELVRAQPAHGGDVLDPNRRRRAGSARP